MNWADYAILATLGLSMLMGLWRGFIGEYPRETEIVELN